MFLVAMVASIAMVIQNLWILVTEFYKYPVTTTWSVDHHRELEMPAITLCNCNQKPTEDYFKDHPDYVSTSR